MKKSPCQRGFFHLTLLHASRCPDPPSYAAVNKLGGAIPLIIHF